LGLPQLRCESPTVADRVTAPCGANWQQISAECPAKAIRKFHELIAQRLVKGTRLDQGREQSAGASAARRPMHLTIGPGSPAKRRVRDCCERLAVPRARRSRDEPWPWRLICLFLGVKLVIYIERRCILWWYRGSRRAVCGKIGRAGSAGLLWLRAEGTLSRSFPIANFPFWPRGHVCGGEQ
jgi:hypothetical protein